MPELLYTHRIVGGEVTVDEDSDEIIPSMYRCKCGFEGDENKIESHLLSV